MGTVTLYCYYCIAILKNCSLKSMHTCILQGRPHKLLWKIKAGVHAGHIAEQLRFFKPITCPALECCARGEAIQLNPGNPSTLSSQSID